MQRQHSATWTIAALVVLILFGLGSSAACTSDSTTSTEVRTSGSTTTAVTTGTASTTETTEATTTSQVKENEPPTTAGAAAQYYSPLTGEPVSSESDTTKPVTGIMIDNHTAARPQSGIKDGEVIVEAIAESGITRFLVLYQQNRPALVGPVRSLRIYDIDWAKPFDCSIGHVGGSESALNEVRNGEYRDIDMFFNGGYYWRSNVHAAPHNVYTSFEKFDALNRAKGYATSHPVGFSRVDGRPSEHPDAVSIAVHLSTAAYDSTYTYDQETNTYTRYQGGKPFVDREAGPVKPSVVIALMVEETKGNVEFGILRERIQTVGSGKAVIFQSGMATEATWHKANQAGQLTFTDAAGNDIALVRGQTWIVAVPNAGGRVSWE
jgi:hypothetical protein